jgi:hypothetical protein
VRDGQKRSEDDRDFAAKFRHQRPEGKARDERNGLENDRDFADEEFERASDTRTPGTDSSPAGNVGLKQRSDEQRS